MKRRKFPEIIIPGISILVIVILAFLFSRPAVIEIRPKTASPLTQAQKPIKLIFVGDIMLDRGVKLKIIKEGKGDFSFPFLKITDYLKKADLVFANLESQISDKGEKIGSIYSFRAPPEAIEGLVFANINIVSLANNHAFDYGREALQDSINRLIEAGINPVGAGNESQAFSPTIKTIGETKIAFFAYTDQGPESWQATQNSIGIAHISQKNLEKINPSTNLRVDTEYNRSIKTDITLAKQLADIVIVSLHAGEEYQESPNISQTTLAHAFIDAGADLVVGHHPHVVQKSETYKGKQIFYSLGNFVFDQSFSKETMEGQILEVLIENNRIKEVKPKTIKINDFFQPEPIR